jgi:hypothetical protein
MKVLPPLLLALVFTLSGCGTYVPPIQEIGDDTQGVLLVQAIVGSVRCEIRNSLAQIYWDDLAAARANGHRSTEFLDSWGAQVQLKLTVEEKTTLNPSVSWMPHAIFTLGGSATGTADATRIDTLNYFYSVAELRSRQGCLPGAPAGSHPASLLVQSDLKLYNWLSSVVVPVVTDDISAVEKQNALSHEVKFEVVSTGTIAPAWKLSRVISVDQLGTLFSATRDRTHDLLITLGPIDTTTTQTLAPTAQNTFFASQINQSIGNSPLRGSGP